MHLLRNVEKIRFYWVRAWLPGVSAAMSAPREKFAVGVGDRWMGIGLGTAHSGRSLSAPLGIMRFTARLTRGIAGPAGWSAVLNRIHPVHHGQAQG